MNLIIFISSILIATFAIQTSEGVRSGTTIVHDSYYPPKPQVTRSGTTRRSRSTGTNSISRNIRRKTDTMGATGTPFVFGDAANQLNLATDRNIGGVQQSTNLQNGPNNLGNNVADRFRPTTPRTIASNSIQQNIRGDTNTMGATGTTFVFGDAANQLNSATDRNVGGVQQSINLQNGPINLGMTRAPTYQSSSVLIPSGNVVQTLVAQKPTVLLHTSAPLTTSVVTSQISSGSVSSCGMDHRGGQQLNIISQVPASTCTPVHIAAVQSPVYTAYAPVQNHHVIVSSH